jgi:Anti-sigma-K factor rskA/Putative zinc-finger
MRLRRPDPHTLAGAYALDALGEADRAAFERHLGSCESCRQEAASLRDTAGWLAEATAVAPPQRLRGQVLAEAARTRQQPPAIRERQNPRRTWLGIAWPTAPRLATAVAGLCILLALALGAMFITTQHRLGVDEAQKHEIAAVLNSPDRHIMTMRLSTHGSVTVVMSHKARALVLTTARLPVLPSADCYQVWLMGPGGVRSAGVLPNPHQGLTAPMIVSGLAVGDRMGLTVEPGNGTKRPTSEPLLMLDLP